MSFISAHTVEYGILKYIKNVVQVESHVANESCYDATSYAGRCRSSASAENPAWAPARIMSGKRPGVEARAAYVRFPSTHMIFSES